MELILSYLSNGIIALLAFLGVLGVLVFVHELGHFVVAKLSGMKVYEFGLGYPPRAVTLFKKDETAYTLNWIPLGGFVRIMGENGEDADDQHSFANKSRTARAAVLVAGSFMNLVLPIFLFAVIAMMGVPVYEDEEIATNRGIIEIIALEEESPAALAGLQPNDEILFVGGQRVKEIETLISLVQQFEGRELTIDFQRDGETQSATLIPEMPEGSGQVRIGVQIALKREQIGTDYYNPIRALAWGADRTWTTFTEMLQGLAQLPQLLLSGDDSESAAIGGPIAIAQITGEIAQTGWQNTINLAAVLSINLAIMNMLPIPALDGGRLLFVIVEALRGGKRVSAEREGMVHVVGMLLLLSLMVVISISDIQRIFSGGSLLQ